VSTPLRSDRALAAPVVVKIISAHTAMPADPFL
jgi:hypothetical protein